MSIRKTVRFIALFSLLAASAVLVGRVSSGAAEAKEEASSIASISYDSGRETPIVMGRSVSMHHKTKLHHIKVKPIDATEKPDAPDAAE